MYLANLRLIFNSGRVAHFSGVGIKTKDIPSAGSLYSYKGAAVIIDKVKQVPEIALGAFVHSNPGFPVE